MGDHCEVCGKDTSELRFTFDGRCDLCEDMHSRHYGMVDTFAHVMDRLDRLDRIVAYLDRLDHGDLSFADFAFLVRKVVEPERHDV